MFFRKNIWTIFYLLAVSGLVLIVLFGNWKQSTVEKQIRDELNSFATLFSQSVNSTLYQNEMMLDLVGRQLLTEQKYLDKTGSQKVFRDLLAVRPSIAGFGITDSEGQFMVTSSNIDPKRMPVLSESAETRDSFLRALDSERMVIGRTYYVSELNSWVIPLRKALRNENGETVAVMTSGLRLDRSGFMSDIKMTNQRVANIYNDINRYQVFVAGIPESLDLTAVYTTPVTRERRQISENFLRENYGYGFEKARTMQSGVSYEVLSRSLGNKVYILRAIYNPTYQIWNITAQPKESLTVEQFNSMYPFVIIYLVYMSVIFWLFRAISESEKRTRRKLVYQANHDALTGLNNRNNLNHFLSNLNAESTQPFKLLFLDLDNFKNINDNFGHHIGDKILIEIGQRLRHFVDSSNHVFRFGGDEFVLIINHDRVADQTLGNEIIGVCTRPCQIDGLAFSVGASIGMAHFPLHANSGDLLLRMADTAMFEAKKQKNQVRVYSEDIHQKNARKSKIEHGLRSALEAGEIYLAYQPQTDFKGKIIGVEALARWKNSELGQVSPAEFIYIAEEIGIMPDLGRFVVRTALRQMRQVQEQTGVPFKVSINASVKQFLEVGFDRYFIDAVEQSGLPKVSITLEVTESLFVEELEFVYTLLQNVKSNGVKISLDDFGTGYSSLSLLKKLPVNEIKIDKSFVDGIATEEHSQSIVRSIVDIANSLNMSTLAEGVESLDQVDLLHSYGCQVFQGFVFSKPLSPESLIEFILREETGQVPASEIKN